jgi:hypothetical protein
MQKLVLFMVCVAALASGGCASTRDFISLELPEAKLSGAAAGKVAVIRVVQDGRVFEEKPRDPSIPSLKGGLRNNPEELRKRAIARKRDADGKVRGDVLLLEDQTVETVVRDLVGNALAGSGYSVMETSSSPDAIIVDVTINKFWSWVLHGSWAYQFGAEIETTLAIESGSKQYQFKTGADAAKGRYQVVTEAAWKNVYGAAIEKYLENTKAALADTL